MKTKIREPFINQITSSLKKGMAFNLTLALLALILTSLTVMVAPAQNIPNRGAKVGNSYAVGDFETVNTTNGNLMLNFPLGSLPGGRGEVGAGINLIYSSKLYDTRIDKIQDPRYSCAPNCTYFEKTVIEQSNKGGWKYAATYNLEFEDRRTRFGVNPPECAYPNNGGPTPFWNEMTYVHKLNVVFPDGSTHEMIPDVSLEWQRDRFYRVKMDGTWEHCGATTQQTPVARPIYYSIDGTYVRLETTSEYNWTLYFSDGRKVVNSATNPQRIYDRNGNYVDTTGAQMTDQFGRSVTVSVNSLGEDEIRSKGVGGEELLWKVKWKNVGVAKTFKACVGIESACPQADQRSRFVDNLRVVDTITQPEQLGGQSYTFSYNAPATIPTSPNTSSGWGEVSGIQLPTGAEISYGYAMDGYNGGDDEWSLKEILRNHPETKTLTYNRQYDGSSTSTTETWTYGTSQSSGGVIGPDGGTTTNYFGNTDQESWWSGLTLKSVSPDGTMKENLWAFNCPYGCLSPGPVSGTNPYVKTEFTSIKDSNNNYSLTAIKDYTYDKNGNVTQVKEYDWVPYNDAHNPTTGELTGIPTGVSPKRITATGYVMQAPDAGTTTTNNYLYIWANSTAKPTNLLHLPLWTETRDGSNTAVSRAEMLYDNLTTGNATAGNLTTSKAWDSIKGVYSNPLTTNNSISATTAYNSYGMPTLTTDAKGYQTQITYGSIIGPSGAVTDLYPTQIVSAYGTSIQQTSQTEYDFYTGLAKKTTALGNTTNENVSSEMVYDAEGRPLVSKAATGTTKEVWTQTSYDDTARRVITKSDLFVKGDGKKVSIQHFDQIGRVRLSRTLENPATEDPTNEQHGVKVQTRYLAGNPTSYQLTSNPYRAATSGAATSEPSMGWTQSKSVNTGKHAETETFAGAGLPTAFGGSNTNSTGVVKTDVDLDRMLVTDQAGKQRISKTNALGQMTDVWELTASDSLTVPVSFPNQSLSAGYQTSYQYDTLSNLIAVNQGQQTRSFSYSSLSRLKTAQNPESGLIQYAYDDNGNLTQKTDARSIQTTYGYDELNRVKTRSYTGEASGQQTSNVTYTYDDPLIGYSKGRLTKVSSASSQTEYTNFDILGRVLAHKQTTDGATYTTAYSYNLSGALISETYPSGRVVKNVLDNNGDLSIVQSKKISTAGYWNYAEHFSFTAAGAVSSMQLGNGKWESTQFNPRLQPTQIALGTVQNGTDNLKLNYTYNSSGQNDNNGNVLSQTITVPTVGQTQGFTATQNYTYDSLNRLKSATEMIGTQTWKQTFLYDRYGNRNFDTANTTTLGTCPANQCNPTIDTANNRFTTGQGYTYDFSGNVKTDAEGRSFTFDGENKQTKVVSNGQTVGEYFYDGNGKRVKKVVPSTGETTIFVYGASGKMVAEYSTVVASQAEAKVSYLTTDHLGSPRITTDANGAVTSRRDFMPFGEEVARAGYGSDSVRQKFTSYERDTESDLDFAQARMYSSKLGRFYSVDPENAGADEYSPQSWNGYIYVGNNPTNFTDPTGLTWVTKDGENYTWVDDDYYNSEDGQREYSADNGWRVGNGDISFIGVLNGTYANGEYNNLLGSYAYHNADGTLSLAGTRGEDGLMMLPIAAGTTLTFPFLSGGSATGAAVGSGTILSNPIVPAAIIGGGLLTFLIANGGPDMMTPAMPALPSTPNSATNTSLPRYASPPNCACSVPVLQMAKGGKQRIKNEYNDEAVRAVGGSIEAQKEYLKSLYKGATNAADRLKIKAAQKAIGGRPNSGGGGKNN